MTRITVRRDNRAEPSSRGNLLATATRWQLQTAKAWFSELFRRARTEGATVDYAGGPTFASILIYRGAPGSFAWRARDRAFV